MAKQTIHGHIYWRQNYKGEAEYTFYEYDMRDWAEDNRSGRVWVREHSIEVDIPDNFDPRPGLVAGLEAEKQRIRAEFAAKVADIDSRISKLLALEMTVDS